MGNLIERAEKLLEGCEVVLLSSVTGEGYPRPCILSKIRTDGIRSLWVATGSNSQKTCHFRGNPKAGVCYMQGGDSVTMLGRVTVLEDQATKDEMWQDWFIDHFPGGQKDPGYCVLRFDAREATIWIDQEFATVTVQ